MPKSIGDLEAVASLIKHVNDGALSSFDATVSNFKQAKAAREQLDATITQLREQLQHSCEEYADARHHLIVGDSTNGPPLMNKILTAQGNANNLMLLDQRVNGCVDSCKLPGQEGKRGPCDLGGCRGMLEGTHRLEQVLGGTQWKRRDDEARRICTTVPDNRTLLIDSPAGWEENVQEAGAFVTSAATTPLPFVLLAARLGAGAYAEAAATTRRRQNRGSKCGDCRGSSSVFTPLLAAAKPESTAVTRQSSPREAVHAPIRCGGSSLLRRRPMMACTLSAFL
eukprot:TRINITY_DN75827_c0_g1_i1.p1 TRINITY_DN75827_c0_g1~~TRINITY_DN75827_c0_g1_i1.p1  ORF type:complete len:282 (-),score=33.86 TRINITY_DN75827_c0_g1_i1:164-1009(-)